MKAELIGPGGFDECIETLLSVPNGCCSHTLKTSLDSLKVKETRLATDSDVRSLLGRLPHDLSDVLLTVFEMVGFNGQISIEKTRSRSSIELFRGYTFKVKTAIPCVASTFLSPYVGCIDGFIESVGEIHHLLETAYEARATLLLFLRGLSDDVKSTLKLNYDRGTLRVIPVVVPFDLEGINVLNDIATVSGVDVTSSLKGELISSLTIHNMKSIPKASIFSDKITLVNSATKASVLSQIKMLRTKRSDDETLSKLIDDRIKSLSSNQVVIRLFDDEHFVTNSQLIDRTIRGLSTLRKHGVFLDGTLAGPKIAGTFYAMKCLEAINSKSIITI